MSSKANNQIIVAADVSLEDSEGLEEFDSLTNNAQRDLSDSDLELLLISICYQLDSDEDMIDGSSLNFLNFHPHSQSISQPLASFILENIRLTINKGGLLSKLQKLFCVLQIVLKNIDIDQEITTLLPTLLSYVLIETYSTFITDERVSELPVAKRMKAELELRETASEMVDYILKKQSYVENLADKICKRLIRVINDEHSKLLPICGALIAFEIITSDDDLWTTGLEVERLNDIIDLCNGNPSNIAEEMLFEAIEPRATYLLQLHCANTIKTANFVV